MGLGRFFGIVANTVRPYGTKRPSSQTISDQHFAPHDSHESCAITELEDFDTPAADVRDMCEQQELRPVSDSADWLPSSFEGGGVPRLPSW